MGYCYTQYTGHEVSSRAYICVHVLQSKKGKHKKTQFICGQEASQVSKSEQKGIEELLPSVPKATDSNGWELLNSYTVI